MQFEVRALARDNVMQTLTVDANDADDARRQVAARGLVVASLTRRAGVRRSGARLNLLLFSQELLALLSAGLGVVEALEALLEKEGGAVLLAVLQRLLAGLREGKRFSTVLAEQSIHFPPLFVGIVQAAEGTSDLPRALARYIDYQQRVDTVRGKIVSASIYPAILLLVGAGVSGFLMTYVVPRFAEVYQGAGRSLPWMSQMLLDWGQFAAAHPASLLALAGVVLLAGGVLAHQMFARGGAVRLLAVLPGIAERVRIYELQRLYLTLGMLVEGGIALVPAIATVQAMASPLLSAGLARARGLIEAGQPLSQAFEVADLTTPIALRMLRVGERSGDMGPMLSQSAAFYDGEITRWIDRFTRTFEPLLMAAIGLVVGTIVVLLYMPIFDLAGDMS